MRTIERYFRNRQRLPSIPVAFESDSKTHFFHSARPRAKKATSMPNSFAPHGIDIPLPPAAPRVLSAARVITTADAPPIEDGAVVLADGQIVWVGQRLALPPAYRHLDTTHYSGATILPGLIETHAHLSSYATFQRPTTPDPDRHDHAWATLASVSAARQLASLGVTTVQSLGSPFFADVALREAVEHGLVAGPRIVAAGPQLTPTGGHARSTGGEADSPDELRRRVRDHHESGVDTIKVMATGGFVTADLAPWGAQFTTAELRAIVDEAHRLGRRTAAHADGTEGIRRAVSAGIDYLAHVSFVDGDTRTSFDPELADVIAEKHIFVDTCSTSPLPPASGETSTPRTLELYRRGVHLVAGNDIGVVLPPSAYVFALQQLELSGLPRTEVLLAATTRAAAAVGLAGVTGTLAAGYDADLIVSDGDPLSDLSVLNRLHEIVIGGRTFVPDLVAPFDPTPLDRGDGPRRVRAATQGRRARPRTRPDPISTFALTH